MVPHAQYTDELRGCKDRFLIQSIPVNDASEAESFEVFRGQGRQDFRLKVIVAPPVALRSVLEGEIRAFAAHQGVDGHRQCMRKFLELLLARGVLSQSQVLLAFGVVAELFNGVRDAEPLDVTRADGVSRWTSKSPFGSSSQLRAGSSTPPSAPGTRSEEAEAPLSPREHVFQADPNAKPLFPAAYRGVSEKKAAAAYSAAFLPAGRHSPATGLSRAGSGASTPAHDPSKLGRGRIDSSGSAAGSETGSGVLEPPSTPSGASVASIEAASTLYSTSIADRFNLRGVRNPPPSPPLRSPSSGGPARRVSEGESDGDEFQDASEALASQSSIEPSGRTI
ncbi:g12767 [Coccomyxa viridis]|uniref:G12767 protein n=1 Tax=Coccomyxa viridis TaxID=1274662 RepID=A0ABP1GB58_9CHLO